MSRYTSHNRGRDIFDPSVFAIPVALFEILLTADVSAIAYHEFKRTQPACKVSVATSRSYLGSGFLPSSTRTLEWDGHLYTRTPYRGGRARALGAAEVKEATPTHSSWNKFQSTRERGARHMTMPTRLVVPWPQGSCTPDSPVASYAFAKWAAATEPKPVRLACHVP